jgi:hypothetical protein
VAALRTCLRGSITAAATFHCHALLAQLGRFRFLKPLDIGLWRRWPSALLTGGRYSELTALHAADATAGRVGDALIFTRKARRSPCAAFLCPSLPNNSVTPTRA